MHLLYVVIKTNSQCLLQGVVEHTRTRIEEQRSEYRIYNTKGLSPLDAKLDVIKSKSF